ncbi:unnamed protein product [Rotaria socialis]|uniref:Uncharacterized protein n=1 Tax=Rotaria socialis TaxID=392032 RepID=A0A819YSZ2_9BILA|nr:unnamed protein product [Rotaria socialis]
MSTMKSTGELRPSPYNNDVIDFEFEQDTPKQVINLANTEIAKTWKSAVLQWHYAHDVKVKYFKVKVPPLDMTLIIETPFTQQRQRYTISLGVERLKSNVARATQIIDDKETDVNMNDSHVTLNCDSNYQVILKFYIESTLYIIWIEYDVIQK